MVPARAGVIPVKPPSAFSAECGSRASGGDPEFDTLVTLILKWFPRERG